MLPREAVKLPTRSVQYGDTVSDPAQQAHYLLYYDELTGLYNRRFYNRVYGEQTRKAAEEHTPLGLILIDVDFFKSVNDRYGHQSGDAILAGVGGIINETVGMYGYPIRYAGDEFVVLLPGLSRQEASQVAETLSVKVREQPFRLVNSDRTIKITFSVGVAHYPEDTEDPLKLFENADHAAFIAKKNGRDRVINYEMGVKHVLDANTLYQYFPCPKLIGRDELLSAALEVLTAPAGEGRPWLIIGGVPGVGKTRFVLELRNRVDTQRSVLLETVGLPTRPSQPFGLIVDVLGKYMRDTPQAGQQMTAALDPQEIATLAKLLPDLSRHVILSSSSEITARRDGAESDPVGPFSKMLEALSQDRSLIVLLDDFQGVDQGSMRVLERLRESSPSAFVCMAVRDDAETIEKSGVLAEFIYHMVESGVAHYVRLEPFTPAEVQQMIEAILPEARKHEHLGQLVYEKSKGIPLLVEEILKLLIYNKSIYYEGPELVVRVASEQIPTDADALLEVRAGQVEDDIRVLMAHAAVIGPEFDFSTLMMLEGRDEGYLRGILERARKAHIVSETWSEDSDRISFVSVHTHAAFYRALDEEERRKLHLRLGRQRERQYAAQLDAALSELAYHFNRAGETERAQQYRKMVSELYNQFVGDTSAPADIGSDDLKQMIGQKELSDDLLGKAVEVIRDFKICLQKIRMYGADHLMRQGSYDRLAQHFAELFTHLEAVTFAEAGKNMLVNGTLLPQNLQYANAFIETLINYDIRALTFHHGVTGSDLKACLEFLCLHKEEVRARGGLGKLLSDVCITTIVPNEKMYVLVGQRDIVLKRTNMREEVLIKEIGEPDDGLEPPAQPTSGAASPFQPEAAPQASSDEARQWEREMARYVDLKLLDSVNRDWRVLQRDLESANRIKIMAASKVYVDARSEAVQPLLWLIGNTEDVRARHIGVSLLVRVTPDARDLLLRALFECTLSQQTCAYIVALQDMADAAIPGEVESFLRHPDRQVRQATIALLASKVQGTLGPYLLRALEVDDDDVRLDLVTAMGELKVEATAPSLAKIIKQKTPMFGSEGPTRLQAAACVALGKIGNTTFLPQVLELLERPGAMQRSRPSIVRAAAVTALQYLVTPLTRGRIVKELEKYEKDQDPMVAAAASKSLAFVQGLKTSEAPLTSPDTPPVDHGKRLLTSTERAPTNIRWRGIRD